MLLYHELLLRLFDRENAFFTPALVLIVVFSLAAGWAVFLLLDLIPHRKTARILGGVLVAAWTVLTCVEYCCKSFFKIYFGLGYMQGMAGQVVGDFGGTMVEVVLARIPFILLALLPLAVYVWLCPVVFMEATVDGYIQDYVNNGTPFHTYYMTVSGHCNYDWTGNAMSRKHQETIQKLYPNASEQVQAYLACNLELEYAMEYLVEQLETAGIADETVIALTADHYPYALVEGDKDYYNELAGTQDSDGDTSRYRNTFILWSGCMEEPVVVDTPCSAIDIVPTLSNLFGLEYDSRLYSGRDIFATNYQEGQYSSNIPLVVFANKGHGSSWITDAGTYEATTKTFTPRAGVTVDENYVSRVSRLVSAKYTYAKLAIERDYYSLVWPKSE